MRKLHPDSIMFAQVDVFLEYILEALSPSSKIALARTAIQHSGN
jgi:hypothetical protein